MAKHKVFLSFYHHDDEKYRRKFEEKFGHLMVIKSVHPGDIDPENSSEYIKRLIRDGYIEDASVVVVLVGPKTKCRKHVDWEISAGLNKKVGGYSGLMGILLPAFPLTRENKYNGSDLPERLRTNVDSGYAKLYSWDSITASGGGLVQALDAAFGRRISAADKIVNASIPQRQRNSCE